MDPKKYINPNSIFCFECTDHEYFLKNHEFLSYPVKDAIVETLDSDGGIAAFFVFDVQVIDKGKVISSESYISRETFERVFQPQGIVEEALELRFNKIRFNTEKEN